MNKKISIILCTYNEVNHIEETLKLIFETLKNVEVIVIDDNSTDGTLEQLNKLKLKLTFKLIVRKNERGLASAHKRGFDESTGDYVGTIDVNSKDQILYFSNLVNKLNDGYDFAVLSRYIVGGGDERIFVRSFASWLIYFVSRLFLRFGFHPVVVTRYERFTATHYKFNLTMKFLVYFLGVNYERKNEKSNS